jgi:hypothetical protein
LTILLTSDAALVAPAAAPYATCFSSAAVETGTHRSAGRLWHRSARVEAGKVGYQQRECQEGGEGTTKVMMLMTERKEGRGGERIGGERIGGERIYVRVDICIERETEKEKKKEREKHIYIYKVYVYSLREIDCMN